MSEGYYAHKARRARLVEEAEELGVSVEGSNNQLAAAIAAAKRPVRQPVDDTARVVRNGREGRQAAARLVARSSRGGFADPDGYANEREAFNDLYGEVS